MSRLHQLRDEMAVADLVNDSNHYLRRFFRCWIDGSYNGEGHYKSNCDFARSNYDNDRRLRSRVISEWCEYLAADYDCSPSSVRAVTISALGENIERLNAELIDDFRDLVRDEMEAA